METYFKRVFCHEEPQTDQQRQTNVQLSTWTGIGMNHVTVVRVLCLKLFQGRYLLQRVQRCSRRITTHPAVLCTFGLTR